jgi:hypothetical protein
MIYELNMDRTLLENQCNSDTTSGLASVCDITEYYDCAIRFMAERKLEC